MASAAFLLAPITAVPKASDDEWESLYCSWNWRVQEIWETFKKRLPSEERAATAGAFSATRTTSNFASFQHLDDREIRRSARRWVEESYRRWLAEGRSTLPNNGPADFAAATGIESRIALDDLLHYRGGFRKLGVRSLRSPIRLGYLSNKGDLDEFTLGSANDFELTIFAEIARAHGGEHLALWTYGHAVHVWHAQSSAAGTKPEITRASFRLRHPGSSPRAAGELSRLRSQLNDSVFAPEWNEIQAQLDAPEISVTRWFLAFGIPGANEIVPTDREAVWSRLENVCLDLLDGRTPDGSTVRQLNRVLRTSDEDSRLPTRPARRPMATARAVAGAVWALTEAIGPSPSPAWQDRERAASFYWDITDGPSLDRITVGSDEDGFGDSASLGRLLGHYPSPLPRDPIFLALAALQAESANGHAFVESLLVLSEHAASAGFTLAAYPAPLDGDFRTSFGLEEGTEADWHPLWAGHGFVDLPERMKASLPDALHAWFAAQQADGHLVRADPDGGFSTSEFRHGQPVPSTLRIQTDLLVEAARNLDLRGAFVAAGLPDLLEPGFWEEGAYDGSAFMPEEDEQQPFAETALRRATPPLEMTSWHDMIHYWRPNLRYRGDKSHREDGIVSLRISIGDAVPDFLAEIRSDLRCSDLIEDYGHIWIDERTVCAYTRADLDLCLLTAILADAPRPIHVVLDLADEGHVEFRLVR